MNIFHGVQYGPNPHVHMLDVYSPSDEQQYPVIIIVHGGGWLAGSRSRAMNQAQILSKEGFVVVACDYSLGGIHLIVRRVLFWITMIGTLYLYIKNAKTIYFIIFLAICSITWLCYAFDPPKPKHFEDIELALNWTQNNIKSYNGLSNRIMLLGHSAGGHLACLLASKRYMDVCGVVSISGVYSLQRLNDIACGDWLIYSAFGDVDDLCQQSPVANVHSHCPPHLLINAKHDVTLQRHTWDMVLTLKAQGVYVKCKTVPGDHLSVMRNWNDPANTLFPVIVSFIRDCVLFNPTNPFCS